MSELTDIRMKYQSLRGPVLLQFNIIKELLFCSGICLESSLQHSGLCKGTVSHNTSIFAAAMRGLNINPQINSAGSFLNLFHDVICQLFL